jgi:hypothetical protein
MAKRMTRDEIEAQLEVLKAEKAAAEAKAKAGWTARQKLGVAVGSVGVSVLGLSVVHCTTAISALTGSPLFLSGLLAVGIDAGMVACELSSIATSKGSSVKGWALTYIVLACLLSCGLNGWASAHHAEEGLRYAAWGVGSLIPVLVFVLGKVAGLLYEEGSSHA